MTREAYCAHLFVINCLDPKSAVSSHTEFDLPTCSGQGKNWNSKRMASKINQAFPTEN